MLGVLQRAIAGGRVKGKSDRVLDRAGPVWVVGAMSGTSMDGVDLAMIHTDGVTIAGFGETRYRPYSEEERAVIRAALGRWPEEAGVAQAARVVEDAHIEAFAGMDGARAFGFHGQTLAHDPAGFRTHQAGDGARIAAETGLTTVWDFRSNDMALGGQGAPLAPFYHWALARHIGAERPLAFLNLGGVGNITLVDPRLDRPDLPGACLAFDTGPANAPIDDLIRARRGDRFDRDGALTCAGRVDDTVVAAFLRDAYFARMPPKSLDRDAFATLADRVEGLRDADAVATLAACAARAVAQALDHLPHLPERVLVTGGGRHNPGLMAMLAKALPCPVAPVEDVGLDGDFLEAQAFGYLAMRVLLGLPTSAPGTTGVAASVGGGRVTRR